MLAKLTRFASPEVKKLLQKIEASENDFEHENRQSSRRKISLPVSVSSLDGEEHLIAFSRDISSNGICLISQTRFERGAKSNLSIDSGNKQEQVQQYMGTCRWSLPFGDSYSVSGWEIDREMDVHGIVMRDAFINSDNRTLDRIKVAIPATINQKDNPIPLEGFTRNMSGQGCCLVSLWPTKIGSFCLLNLFAGDGEQHDVVAECVWSRPFGKNYTTGWEFPRLDRIQQFHRASWPM